MVLKRRASVLIPVLLLFACGGAALDDADAPPPKEGEMVYNSTCAVCHGRGGDLGMGGAKNLVTSTLTRPEVIAVITNGRGAMMPYGGQLTKKQLEAVADHVLSLRTPPASE